MPTFDIVSKTDLAEVDNALGNIVREIETRFDFKGSKCSIERKDDDLTLLADDQPKLKQMHELLKVRSRKRPRATPCARPSRSNRASTRTSPKNW
jgi:uncharacterized protein YajQ (UPF0234 family)